MTSTIEYFIYIILPIILFFIILFYITLIIFYINLKKTIKILICESLIKTNTNTNIKNDKIISFYDSYKRTFNGESENNKSGELISSDEHMSSDYTSIVNTPNNSDKNDLVSPSNIVNIDELTTMKTYYEPEWNNKPIKEDINPYNNLKY